MKPEDYLLYSNARLSEDSHNVSEFCTMNMIALSFLLVALPVAQAFHGVSIAKSFPTTTTISVLTGNPLIQQQQGRLSKLLLSSIDEIDVEKEVERIFQEEKEKTLRMSRFSNEKGMEYAPWMNMTPDDEARIRTLAREKTMARKKRQMQEQNVRGALLKDSTNQELSGTGVQYKIIDGDSVELEWSTESEPNTIGYIVKRRQSKTNDFVTIASYETHPTLLSSKGVTGGTYRYLDENVGEGVSYMYRITEKEIDDEENDLSQCLVEIQSNSEKQTQLIATIGFLTLAVGTLAAGLLLDPVQ